MTRKEYIAVAKQSNPNLNRAQSAFLTITSPVFVKIVNRQVEKRLDAFADAIATSDFIADNQK